MFSSNVQLFHTSLLLDIALCECNALTECLSICKSLSSNHIIEQKRQCHIMSWEYIGQKLLEGRLLHPQSITKWGYSAEAPWNLEAAGFDLVYCGELKTETIQLWIGSSFNICRSSMIMTYEIAAHWWGNHNQFPRPWWRIAFPLNQLSHVSGTYATSQVSPSKHTHRSLKSAVNSFVWWRTLCIPVVMDLLALNYGLRVTCKHWIFHSLLAGC